MITTIELKTSDDVFKKLTRAENFSKAKGKRTSFYLYKGVQNDDNVLQSSLEKNYGQNQRILEKNILRNFAKYASMIENPQYISSEWRQMIVGEHHGLPTRMLDWTRSPLIALHFAISDESLAKLDHNNCAIWAIDVEETNKMLPEAYKEKIQNPKAHVFTMETLEELAKDLDEYDDQMGGNAFAVLEPPSIDERIVNRYSFFSVTPTKIQSFYDFLSTRTTHTKKYIISKEIKWQIRDMLDTMNINERMLSPGYDGLCCWLKRHYFNRMA